MKTDIPEIVSLSDCDEAFMVPYESQSFDDASFEEMKWAVHDCLQFLTPRQRDAVILRFWEDKTFKAAALEMGVSAANIQALIAKAIRNMRSQFFWQIFNRTGKASLFIFGKKKGSASKGRCPDAK